MKTVFDTIYEKNRWNSKESVSGVGSTLKKTRALREVLPSFLREKEIHRFLDAPCGDFNWMKEVDLGDTHYIGGDIVEALVNKTREIHGNEKREFIHLDLVHDELPNADAILCRDCMIHIPNDKVQTLLQNIKKSGIRWVMLTTYPDVEVNKKIREGSWRKINLQAAPFNLPTPDISWDEEETGWNSGKFIGIWDFSQIELTF
jgi:SAM-dependent methyltransferase